MRTRGPGFDLNQNRARGSYPIIKKAGLRSSPGCLERKALRPNTESRGEAILSSITFFSANRLGAQPSRATSPDDPHRKLKIASYNVRNVKGTAIALCVRAQPLLYALGIPADLEMAIRDSLE